MPKALLDFMGYCIYFWSNESDEPIHVHISKGIQAENATKFWITRDDWVNRDTIIARWFQHFGV